MQAGHVSDDTHSNFSNASYQYDHADDAAPDGAFLPTGSGRPPVVVANTSVAYPPTDRWRFFRSRPRRFLILVALGIGLFLYTQTRLDTEQEPRVCLDPADLEALRHPAHAAAIPLPPSTSTVTVTAPAATHTVLVDHAVAARQEPVVFALIMWSQTSAIEGAILLKSAIMYSSRPLEFHIVADEGGQTYLEKRLSLLTKPVYNISVHFYRPSWQSMVDRIDREGNIMTTHLAGVPGLMKLFLHEILPDTVSKAIYVDTDAFFLTDPALLWDRFDRMNDTVAISMPTHPDQSAPQWHDGNKICSCIMLLHFDRLRAMRVMDSSIYRADTSGLFPPALSPPTFEALFGTRGADGRFTSGGLGDQEYFWAIVSGRPDIFEHLSYDWEVSSCLLDMYGTRIGQDDASEDDDRPNMVHVLDTPHEGTVILPKLVHFNAFSAVDVYFEWDGWYDPDNPLTAHWGSALDYHVGTKWIWLNRGNASIDIQTVMEPLFSDQRFERWRAQVGEHS